ncbi:MAG: undecaprenyldiphospho-muramoylpentapeptide beta-N-acetylglucosaminyltransferase [Bryobacterales bacterium]|nr:undecaprenyldiphospho-muramoylpentapeptide beta-N-acetylglucosaminyltransferase [Bryobacterales bacterium]
MKVRIRHLYKRKKASASGKGSARQFTFLLTGGGTGGHVIPAIAVARELRKRGHRTFFVGTREGLESKLVPPENMPLEFVEIGGLKRVGWRQALRTVWQLPAAVVRSMQLIRRYRPAAVFSMGGYVAGPATLAAWILRRPVVLMEPNAMPGMANRYMAKIAARACLSFPEAKEFFPADRVEMTGLPVRSEFFEIPKKAPGGKLTVLVTGGSRGSRRLNDAGKASWPLFQANQAAIRWIHQTGSQDYAEMAAAFRELGCEGLVAPFIENMPQAFAQSDLIVCRSGAGAVAELAAAGKPSILVPFPFAADEHQLRNAEAMSKAGAARLVLDKEMTGEELFHTVQSLTAEPGLLERMGQAARQFARPSAARRAAEILEEEASGGKRRKSS